MKTNCIICNKEVENWDEAYSNLESQVHPIRGTVFRTYGHYGSTVFDPMDGTYLDIVLCDKCLKDRLGLTYRGVNEEMMEEIAERKKENEDLLFVEFTDDK